MAYVPRGIRSRSPDSSRGRNAPPGRLGKPITGRSRTGNRISRTYEACAMQNAQTYLEIVKSGGERRLELRRVYHNLRNRELFLHAYGKLYSNDGPSTPGRPCLLRWPPGPRINAAPEKERTQSDSNCWPSPRPSSGTCLASLGCSLEGLCPVTAKQNLN